MKDSIKEVLNMNMDNLIWKPYHANNMIQNGLDGYYTVILKKDKDGKVSGRKYTILFQYESDNNGLILNKDKPELYILFEKSYYDVKGPLEHPQPSFGENLKFFEDENITLSDCEVNSFGTFVHAFKNVEDAKERALRQYQHIYGYVASFLED